MAAGNADQAGAHGGQAADGLAAVHGGQPWLRVSAGQLVVDPGQPPVPDGAILIKGDRIVFAGPESAVPSPPNSLQLRFGGCTALSGLIDSHVHLTLNAGADSLAVLDSEDDDALVRRALGNARAMASAGITTVLDLGARGNVGFHIASEAAGSAHGAARVLAAGAPITPSRGHAWFMGGEADSRAAVAAAVQDRAEHGAAFIKVMATGGALTAGTSPASASYPVDVLTSAAREAHRLGLPITAHAHGAAGIRAAVAAGFDAVEHATMLGTGGGWEFDSALASQLAAAGMRVIPTAAAGRRYERSGASWTAALPGPATSSQTRTRNAGRLFEAGVCIVAGTDAGAPHTDFGEELFCELEAYVAVGMPPRAAIATATTSAAAHLGLEADIGTLAAGRAADVLVVSGDPLSDITALRHTRLVIRAGVPIDPTPPPAEPP